MGLRPLEFRFSYSYQYTHCSLPGWSFSLWAVSTRIMRPFKLRREPERAETGVELLPSVNDSTYARSEVPFEGRKGNDLSVWPSTPLSSSMSRGSSRGSAYAAPEQPPAYSMSPRPLSKSPTVYYTLLFFDIVLCLVPVSFLILAIMTGMLDGKKVDAWGNRVERWSLLVCIGIVGDLGSC
jgi:hypothetical protein